MMKDIVYIEIRTCKMTLRELIVEIEKLQAEHPDQDIFMDGDAYAIVGAPKRRH